MTLFCRSGDRKIMPINILIFFTINDNMTEYTVGEKCTNFEKDRVSY